MMLFWLLGILAGVLIGIADMFLLIREKRVGVCVHAVLRDAILSNLLALSFMKYVLHIANIFAPELHGKLYPLKYTAVVLAFGCVLLLTRGFLTNILQTVPQPPKRKAGSWILRIFSALFFALGVAAFTGTIWGKSTFGNLAPDEMLISLLSPTTGTSDEVMVTLLEGPILQTAVLTALFCAFAFSARKIVYQLKEKSVTVFPGLARRILCFVLALAVLAGGITFGVKKFQLQKLYSAYVDDSPFVADHFADPNTTKMKFPEQKRNLIHIYLESMENTYYSQDLGGYMEKNLMPDLAELSKEGYSFSHLPEGFGGPTVNTGGTWSVAAMVNMSTGVPMKTPTTPNAYGTAGNFLPGATTLGDILKEQGYAQTVMFGADATFGGLNHYFHDHGDFRILDWNGVKAEGWLPADYSVWWGYEDTKLFEFAKKELTRLSETGKPFHFVMETADTHFPDGYLEPDAEKPFESQYANVIFHNQKQVVEFVRWIQAQPFYENTTIVLIGDHLSMDQKFFADVDPSYQRTCFNLILNPAPSIRHIPQKHMHNRQWASFDMFPTILSSIGVEIKGDRLGIGTDLFSDKQTLFEEYGVDFVNTELVKGSSFYNENILTGDNSGYTPQYGDQGKK